MIVQGKDTSSAHSQESRVTVDKSNHQFHTVLLISVAVSVAGLFGTFFLTKPFHWVLLAIMLIFSIIESSAFVARVKNHLTFLETWPAILASFTISLIGGVVVLWIITQLLGLLSPITLPAFILANLVFVFVTGFIHSLISLEFLKKFLSLKHGEDFKENLLIATAIKPGTRAITSGIKGIITTLIVLVGLAFVLTVFITQSVSTMVDGFSKIPEDQLLIPKAEGLDDIQQFQIMKDLGEKYGQWNNILYDDRQKILDIRNVISGNLIEDTILFLKGNIFSALSEVQSAAGDINARTRAAKSDFDALQHALGQVSDYLQDGAGEIPQSTRLSIENDLEMQLELFDEIKDAKFRVDLPINSIKTDLGEINLNDFLPDPESEDSSILGNIYSKFFKTTAFYMDSQMILRAMQTTRLLEKELIEELRQYPVYEAGPSKYIRMTILLKHVLDYNTDYCLSLQNKGECFSRTKLINKENFVLIDEETAKKFCAE